MFVSLHPPAIVCLDCLVPHGYPEDPSFAEWVHRQRTTHAHMLKEEEQHQRHSPLVEERMKKLQDLGFHFTVHADKWKEHFLELKKYKEIHGHCQIPTHFQTNPKLGRWVHTQRHQRRLQLKGKKSCMTDERVELLDSLGFSWEVRPHQASRAEDIHHVEPQFGASPIENDDVHGDHNMFGDLLVSIHSDDLHPESHAVCDNSSTTSGQSPDLGCDYQSNQDGSQVDLFVHGMTMV